MAITYLDSAPKSKITYLDDAQPEPAAPSLVDREKRSAMLGVRGLAQGAQDLVSLPSQLLFAAPNLALEKLGVNFRLPTQFTAATDAMDQAGMPQPESGYERSISGLQRAAVGGAVPIAAGQSLAQSGSRVVAGVGNALAASPKAQILASQTGEGSRQIAEAGGAGQGGQLAAMMAGASAPSLLRSGSAAATKGAFRGGASRDQIADNIRSFRAVGTSPTVGQATEGRVGRGVESLLARTPGSAGVMAKTSERMAANVGANLDDQAAKLSSKSGGVQAGTAITKGISGDGGFVEQFRGKAGKLYEAVDQNIPPQSQVSVSNTQAALADLTKVIKGAEATSTRLINPRIADIAKDIATDAPNGSVPYEALKSIRTRVGAELDGAALNSDVPAAQWKKLYGALSKDMEAAANNAGPAAQKAFARANTYYKAGSARLEVLEGVLKRNGGPEAVFRAATSGTKEGATTLRTVMQSLPKDGQQAVTATVLRRLGKATAGVQNEAGDVFSSETFLTNWNSLSPEAKAVLFDRHGSQFRQNMDQVAKYAANLRAGSGVFKNPSGTGQAVAQTSAATGFLLSLVTGNFGAATAIASGVGGANLAGRLMTNPRFVEWLAKATRAPQSAGPAMLAQMARSADPEVREFALAQQQVQNEPAQQ